jgi:two-component system response regulator MprA
MMREDERGADTCNILLVEDDAAIRAVVADLLRDEGYTVTEAADGAAAIDALERNDRIGSIALVVLDMNLPHVDGLGVLRHIAGKGLFVPVIAMSAAMSNLAAAQASGARDALLKPFELERFLDVVARNCPITTE